MTSLERAPTQYKWYPHKKWTFGQRDKQKEENMETRGEQHPQAKERLPGAGRETWTSFSLPVPEGANPACPLISDSPASRTDTIIFCCLSHLVHSAVWQQPQEGHTHAKVKNTDCDPQVRKVPGGFYVGASHGHRDLESSLKVIPVRVGQSRKPKRREFI